MILTCAEYVRHSQSNVSHFTYISVSVHYDWNIISHIVDFPAKKYATKKLNFRQCGLKWKNENIVQLDVGKLSPEFNEMSKLVE